MNTIIRVLKLWNWQCYRGEHRLKLNKGVYAITARYANDADASNAAGKTSILEAIEFALYGQHRWRYEDDWITEGEDEGQVTLELTDGTIIQRTRKRGKSTQLFVETTDAEEEGRNIIRKGEEAQLYLEGQLGLSNEDFRASSYLRQKHLSEFVVGDPATRRSIISGWFDLEKLVAAEKFAKGKADAAESHALSREVVARSAEASARALVSPDSTDVFADLQVQGEELVAHLEAVTARRAEMVAARDAWTQRNAAHAAYLVMKKNFDAVCEKGKAAKEAVEKLGDIAPKRANMESAKAMVDANVESQKVATREVARLKKLVTGGFDGVCPVTKNECPAAESVRGCVQLYQTQLAEAQKTLDGSVDRVKHWMGVYNERLAAVTAHQAAIDDLAALREKAKALKPAPVPEPGPEPEATTAIDAEIAAVNKRIGSVEAALALRTHCETAKKEAEAFRAEMKRWRKVRLIFGKNGAQRRVAERLMKSIEARANELLRNAGIHLTVAITWSREGKDLADECESCGFRFGSRGGKVCEKCSAERPPKLVQRLEVDLSDRSGALEDLAGIAIQMAASEWLRIQRGSPWAVLMLDEPYGSLDKTNRLSISAGIAKLLETWDQGFVISHTPDTALAMPRRIEIVAEERGSKVTVT